MRSLAPQGFVRRPAPGGGGKSPAILTPEKALKKVESEWNCSEQPLRKGVKNRGERALFGPIFEKSGWGREWHSRGQRFDPAYLHQKRPEIVRFQVFFIKITTKWGISILPDLAEQWNGLWEECE